MIAHLANAPLGRQALVLRSSKCFGSIDPHESFIIPCVFLLKAVKTGTILCTFVCRPGLSLIGTGGSDLELFTYLNEDPPSPFILDTRPHAIPRPKVL